MKISTFQQQMREKFGKEDKEKSPYILTTALMEEAGEVAKAVFKKPGSNLEEELADVIFVATCLANFYGIDLEKVLEEKYSRGSLEEITKNW